MQLFLHIGANKTGSSFLQTVLMKNKKSLLHQGYYFPDSKWDSQMLNGNISPGNGGELAWSLVRLNEKKVNTILVNFFLEASKNNVSNVIVSNETLIRVFSDLKCISLLEKLAVSAGFKGVSCFSFLRSPHSHALSLYKHRNKYGNGLYKEYKSWMESDYEYLRLLIPFVKNSRISNTISWTFELYSSDQQVLTNKFFSDWLGVSIKVPKSREKVNGSLTLKEIRLIYLLNDQNPSLGRIAYNNLIETSDKIESAIEHNLFVSAFENYFGHWVQSLEEVKSIFSGTDWIKFIQLGKLKVINKEAETFTEEQMKAIIYSHWFFMDNAFKLSLRNGVNNLVQRIRRNLFLDESINRRFGGSINK